MNMNYLWIAIGGALGTLARYWSSHFIMQHTITTFPWDTIIINTLGAFIIGFFSEITGHSEKMMISPEMRECIMIGICGGYTTFSSFSLQTFKLLADAKFIQAGLNSIVSIIFCLMSVWLGYKLASIINLKIQ